LPVEWNADTKILLSECPFPDCLASFPKEYRILRLHLAKEHFHQELEAALLKKYNGKVWLEKNCFVCGAELFSGLAHFYLIHGFLDRTLEKFFSVPLRSALTVCPHAGCSYSAISFEDLVREVYPLPLLVFTLQEKEFFLT